MNYSRVTVTVNGEREWNTMEFEVANSTVEEESPELLEVEMGEAANAEGGGRPPRSPCTDLAVADAAAAENEEEQARIEANTAIEEAKARRYKGLGKKRSRKFTRVLQGENDQKRSTYDYAGVRAENNLAPTTTSQQIASTIAPPKPTSPLKKQLKRINKALVNDSSRKDGVISGLERKNKNKSEKIAALKSDNRELRRQLLLEKKVSNMIIQESIHEAETAMTQAHTIMREAAKKKSSAEDLILAEKERSNRAIRQERTYSAQKLEASKCLTVVSCYVAY